MKSFYFGEKFMSQDNKSPDTSTSDFDEAAAVAKASHPEGSAAHNEQIQREIRTHRPISQANGLVRKSGLTG